MRLIILGQENKMSKPNNWYQMTWEEQKEWKKIQDAIEEAEWNTRQAQEEASQSIHLAARRLHEAEENWNQEYHELSSELRCAKEALRMIVQKSSDSAIVEIAKKGLDGSLDLEYDGTDF